MTFYVAVLMCLAAANGEVCGWRSLLQPVAEPDAYWGICIRSRAATERGAWRVGGIYICSQRPLDPRTYPPMAAPVPPGRFA